jgi:C_GCAxxG_C_C family probable redox protein
MKRSEKAVELFESGLNCSQAILVAFAEGTALDPELAAKLAGGFGGGMGRMAHTCGAVTGAFLVLGLKCGTASPDDKAGKEKTYRLVREFAEKFQARNESIVCRDLLGCDISTETGSNRAKENGLFRKVCPKLVRDAAEILEGMLEETKS